jgi:hypothetical protein
LHDAFAADMLDQQTPEWPRLSVPSRKRPFRTVGPARLEVSTDLGRRRDGRQGGRHGCDPLMAERAGPTITEADGSNVVIAQPETVAEVISTAVAAVDRQPIAAGGS